MRRIIFTVLAIIFTLNAAKGQEKGLHLFAGGNVGYTKFNYTLDGGSARGSVGYGGGIGAQYFFTNYIGLSLGVAVNQFNTNSYYSSKEFRFANQVDDEGDTYQLRVALSDWQENQSTLFLDIPLMLALQKKFGVAEQHGIYFGAGIKAQLALQSEYGRNDGSVGVYAYYKQWELTLGGNIPLPKHNLGVNANREWLGNNKLKAGLSLTGEFGFLFGLSRRVDLRLGVTADYGLINIKGSNEPFIEPTDVQQYGDYIGDKINYVGMLNGDNTGSKIVPLSIQGSLGLRVKIGKLKEKKTPEKLPDRGCCHDTIKVNVNVHVDRDTIIINNHINIEVPAQPQKTEDDRKPDSMIPGWYIPTEEERNNMNDPLIKSQMLQKIKTIEESMEESIYFDLDKYNLKPASTAALDRKVALMKQYPALKITLVGHTCDMGDDKLNDNLSFQREKMARLYMVSEGISVRRLNGIPMGKQFPIYPNTNEHNRSLNRRVDFRITD